MLNNFFAFMKVADDGSIQSVEDFLQKYEGQSFRNGLYRLFKLGDVPKWTEIIRKSFPQYPGNIRVFGFDWLGSILALEEDRNVVIIFEPGTGRQLNTKANFMDFHDVLAPEYPQDCFAFDFFNKWFDANEHYELEYSQCVGYKVPLFLNGNDELENLEVSDMEVYWEIMMPLMNL